MSLSLSSGPHNDPIKVLYWPYIHYRAQYFLRYLWPAVELVKHGIAVKLKDPRKNHLWTEEQMAKDFLWADIVFAFFPKTRTGPELVKLCEKFNRKLVVDVDDYSFAVDPTNPSYSFAAMRDVYFGDTPVWIEGVHYSKEVTEQNHYRWMRVMEAASMTTVTTNVLADFYQGFTDKLWVVPNCIDLRYYKKWDRKYPDDEIRIGWQGGASHYKDFYMIVPALKEILAKNKNVKLVIFGQIWSSHIDEIDSARIETYPWVDSDAFTLKLGSLDLDIGLCPIEDTLFSKGKSNLKQIEYGAFSIPSVCSKIPHGPYSHPEGITDHGVDGMLTDNTTESWVENIQYLIDNKSDRIEMGRLYRKKVEALYDIREGWVEWRNMFIDIADKRILGAAV